MEREINSAQGRQRLSVSGRAVADQLQAAFESGGDLIETFRMATGGSAPSSHNTCVNTVAVMLGMLGKAPVADITAWQQAARR